MFNENMIKKEFDRNGYVLIDANLNSNNKFKTITKKIYKDLNSQLLRKDLSYLGGYIMGNLNVNQGNYGSILFSLVFKKKIIKIFEKITGKNLKTFDVLFGGNLSFPNKGSQIFHTDGTFDQKMYLISFATEDITEENGPTEVCLGTSIKPLKYWQFFLTKKKKKKLLLKKGQVLIRKHSLWHRGTINNTVKTRLLLSFILTPKKRELKISNYKKLTILPNFFSSNLKGKVHEFIYTYLQNFLKYFKFLVSIIMNK